MSVMDLVTRSEWGARYADGFRDRPMPFTEFWLHHSVTIAPDLLPPFTDDDAACRTLENIGQSRFGGGISYNQPVTPVGRMYVGVSPHRQGAHTKYHNTVGFAFVLVGNYSTRPCTAAQEEKIARRMVELHRAGKATRHTLNGGHRDASGSSTACPGDAAHARIGAINRRANELWALNYPMVDPATGVPVSPPSGLLVIDGGIGPRTIVRWQTEMKSKGYEIVVDGEIDEDDSLLVHAVQHYLNKRGMPDREGQPLRLNGQGIRSNNAGRYPAGTGTTDTMEALERYLSRPINGWWTTGDDDAKALQRRLNADTF